MSVPRRKIVRSVAAPPNRNLQKLRSRLEQEKATLVRWEKRLRRAFNAVAKTQRSIHQLEQRLAPRENS